MIRTANVTTCRLALFAVDVGWRDVTRLMRDRHTLGLADQLYRALGSILMNEAIEETELPAVLCATGV
jgi:hypothetical protein